MLGLILALYGRHVPHDGVNLTNTKAQIIVVSSSCVIIPRPQAESRHMLEMLSWALIQRQQLV